MDDRQIPLEQRMRAAMPRDYTLPAAMGLYAEDFYAVVGRITSQAARYEQI